MRNITFFAILCVALVTVLAIPTPTLTSPVVASFKHGISRQGAITQEVRVALGKKYSLQEQYQPSDWFSDLISAILGVNVGELLTTINNTLKALQSLITLAVTQLKDIMNSVDPTVKAEIQDIINVALGEALQIITPLMEDLGLVLPQITYKAATTKATIKDASDTLLGISLEEFLIKVSNVMESSDALLTNTMGKIKIIADNVKAANPGVAADLSETSDDCLKAGKAVIKPVLDSLYQVLPSTVKISPKGQAVSIIKNPNGIFADVISTVLGFNVAVAGLQLEMALEDLNEILESYVITVNKILIGYPQIQAEAAVKLETSIREIRNTIRPINNVLIQFVSGGMGGKDINSGIVGSILGVSLDNFLNYVDFASDRIEEIVRETIVQTETLAYKSGVLNLLAMRTLNDKSSKAADQVVAPFLETISPILPGDRCWVSSDEFLNHIETLKTVGSPQRKVFCDFSFSKGNNTEFIIDIISSIIGFNVVSAANELEVALEGLDQLLLSASVELNAILGGYSDSECRIKANGIIQKAIYDSQVTLHPILDILVEFLPNEARLQKNILNGIINSIAGVSFEEFVYYMEFAVNHFEDVVENAVADVHGAVAGSEIDIVEAVDTLLDKTMKSGAKIIRPFQTIVTSSISD